MAEQLDPTQCWWVPAVTAPCRDWPGHPGCRKGARYLVSAATFRAAHQDYPVFSTRADCLQWIMRHRAELAQGAPGAPVAAVDLARWMLGLN